MTRGANVVNALSPPPLEKLPLNVCTYNVNSCVNDKKVYTSCFINKYRVSAMVDNGSDLSIIHLSLFNKIKRNTSYVPSKDFNITSFSNNSIEVLGTYDINLIFNPNQCGIPTKFVIIEDIPNTPPCLLGSNLLAAGLGVLSFDGNKDSPTPSLYFKHPEYIVAKTYFLSPRESMTFEVYIELPPNATSDIEVSINPCFRGVHTDLVLLTSQIYNQIMIIPSKSDLVFNHSIDSWVGTCRVVNISSTPFSGFCSGNAELITSFISTPLDNKTDNEIKAYMTINPLGREVLPPPINSPTS
jgi:hypothetical protein